MLTDTSVRTAKPQDKDYKLSDERGLYLLVTRQGGKLWRLKYYFEKKEKLLAFGAYPDVSLKVAREKRDDARALLANGIDPNENKKAIKKAGEAARADSFEVLGHEWFSQMSGGWALSHSSKIMARLKNDVFPWIGSHPVSTITTPQILEVLRRIEGRGARETAHRVGQTIGQIMRYAIATGRAERNPVPDLKGALAPVDGGHHPTFTKPDQVGALMRNIDALEASLVVHSALKLAPLVFVRPGELRQARWKDIDFEEKEWRFVASKTHVDHVVPLSNQAIDILKEVQALTGAGEFVFTNGKSKSRAMSEAGLNNALRRMGYDTKTEITIHGLRATARTMLAQEPGLEFPEAIIEHQLAHKVKDANGTAYNRTKFIAQRREMMQRWADYLDKLKKTN